MSNSICNDGLGAHLALVHLPTTKRQRTHHFCLLQTCRVNALMWDVESSQNLCADITLFFLLRYAGNIKFTKNPTVWLKSIHFQVLLGCLFGTYRKFLQFHHGEISSAGRKILQHPALLSQKIPPFLAWKFHGWSTYPP